MKLWSVLLAAAAIVSAKDPAAEAEKHHRHHSSSSSSSNIDSWTTLSSSSEERTSVRVGVDNGNYAFTYGNANTFAFQSFIVESRHLTILSVTDCFLPGDVFQIYDNGQFMMVTDKCPNGGPIAKPKECDLEYCPETCFACDSNFCHNFGYLLPGWHNITIAVLRSASTAGAGYLRVDTACEVNEECEGTYPIPCCQLGCSHQPCSTNVSPYGFLDAFVDA